MKQKLNDLTGKQWLQYSFSIWRDIKKGPLDDVKFNPAPFPVELPSRIIKIFSKPMEYILDPFMGSGSTVVASIINGRNSVGVELSEKYYEEAKARVNRLELEKLSNPDLDIKLYNGNSLELENFVDNNSIDLCITSPPYWDVLNRKRSADGKKNIRYSDSTNDLGNIVDYNLFLEKLMEVFYKVHTTLKNKGYCVVVLMDIRKGSIFYPFHSDLSTLMTKIGYKFKDIIIWDRQKEYNNMRPLGYPYSFVVNKVHEYVLIFQKSDD